MCPEYRFRMKWEGVMASCGTPLRCSDSVGADGNNRQSVSHITKHLRSHGNKVCWVSAFRFLILLRQESTLSGFSCYIINLRHQIIVELQKHFDTDTIMILYSKKPLTKSYKLFDFILNQSDPCWCTAGLENMLFGARNSLDISVHLFC